MLLRPTSWIKPNTALGHWKIMKLTGRYGLEGSWGCNLTTTQKYPCVFSPRCFCSSPFHILDKVKGKMCVCWSKWWLFKDLFKNITAIVGDSWSILIHGSTINNLPLQDTVENNHRLDGAKTWEIMGYLPYQPSNEKNPGWLGNLGDYTTQLYRDCNKPLWGSLSTNQYNGK